MVTSCRVCDEPLPESADRCAKCGYPTALADRLDGPVSLPADTEAAPMEAPPLQPVRRSLAADPEAEVNASLARSLQERAELLLTIDRDAPNVTGELCEAALNETSGRVTDAQQVLRSAQRRLDQETEELLGRHLETLETRGRSLEATGLRLALEDELGHLAESIVSGDVAASVAALAAAERRMDGLESRWRGLQELIAQVTTLREEAAGLGIPLDRVPDRLATARAGLASMPVTERDLDVVAQAAAETLMRLHEAIPPALEQELSRHAGTLEAHRGRPPRLQSARRHHAEAVQHLKSGRLGDAVRSVRELRAAIDELAQRSEEARPPRGAELAAAPTAPPRPEPAVAPLPTEPVLAPGPRPSPGSAAQGREAIPPLPRAGARTPADAATIDALVKKARSLAIRVRSLPHDSEEATSAARQIHEATELLRSRRYDEADAALSRLMRALAGAGSRS